jgi:hypothetical protein
LALVPVKLKSHRVFFVGIALTGLASLVYLLWSSARTPVSCIVIGQTNAASGIVHVIFELSNSYSSSVFVGLYSVDAKTASGWRSVRKEEHGEPLAGVPAGGTKRFSFSPPRDLSVWRLRLIYTAPRTWFHDLVDFGFLRLFGEGCLWVEFVTTPEISDQSEPNQPAAPNDGPATSAAHSDGAGEGRHR